MCKIKRYRILQTKRFLFERNDSYQRRKQIQGINQNMLYDVVDSLSSFTRHLHSESFREIAESMDGKIKSAVHSL